TVTGRNQIDFDGSGTDPSLNFTLIPYHPAAGQPGGSISNVTIGTSGSGGLAGMATGSGSDNTPPAPLDLITGDFNGDGTPDLVILNTGLSTFSLFTGTDKGTFTLSGNPVPTGLAPAGLATGDFNHDGRLDLAVANRGDDSISIYLGNNSGSLGVISANSASAHST